MGYAGQEIPAEGGRAVATWPLEFGPMGRRTFAHVILFGECIERGSRLCFLYALCLGIRWGRHEDGLCVDG